MILMCLILQPKHTVHYGLNIKLPVVPLIQLISLKEELVVRICIIPTTPDY